MCYKRKMYQLHIYLFILGSMSESIFLTDTNGHEFSFSPYNSLCDITVTRTELSLQSVWFVVATEERLTLNYHSLVLNGH